MKETDILRPKFKKLLSVDLIDIIKEGDKIVEVIDNNPEVWTDIEHMDNNYKDYEVSSKGRIRRKDTKEFVHLSFIRRQGTYKVSLYYLDKNFKKKKADEYLNVIVYNEFFVRPKSKRTKDYVLVLDDLNGKNVHWANISLLTRKEWHKKYTDVGRIPIPTYSAYDIPIDAIKVSHENDIHNLMNDEIGTVYHFETIRKAASTLNVFWSDIKESILTNCPARGFQFSTSVSIEQVNKARDFYQELIDKEPEERVENLPGEIWKPLTIRHMEKLYQISNKGRVKSMYTHKMPYTSLVKTKKNCFGRISVYLSYNGIKKEFSLARLVASIFIPNPNNYPIIHHKDSHIEHNYIENLEWTTQEQNMQYAVLEGHLGGSHHYFAPIIVKKADGTIENLPSISNFVHKYHIHVDKVMKAIVYHEKLYNSKTWFLIAYDNVGRKIDIVEGLTKEYSVFTTGKIFNHTDEKFENTMNESTVWLEVNDKLKEFSIAWLVLGTFYPSTNNWESNLERDILFADGDKTNCRLDNLLWI